MTDIFTHKCSYCGKGLMECECENFHPNIIYTEQGPPDFKLTLGECQVLCGFLRRAYIPYDAIKLHEVLNKLFKFVEEKG